MSKGPRCLGLYRRHLYQAKDGGLVLRRFDWCIRCLHAKGPTRVEREIAAAWASRR